MCSLNLDFETVDRLRQRHSAWRLLCSPHAQLVLVEKLRIEA